VTPYYDADHKRDPTKGRLVPASEAMNTTGRRQSEDDIKRGIISGGEDQQGFITHTTTLGWSDCDCRVATSSHGPSYEAFRPGLTLDPFAGSGTTAIAAATTGRNSVLIDLDPRSVHLVRQRITDNLHIISEETDGNTWRWTVETVTRQEIEAITAGQETLW
jgi:hypothetical protein